MVSRLLWPWIVVLVGLSAKPADACIREHRSATRLLGLAPSGAFLLASHVEYTEADDVSEHSFAFYDAWGKLSWLIGDRSVEDHSEWIQRSEQEAPWPTETFARWPASRVEEFLTTRLDLSPAAESPLPIVEGHATRARCGTLDVVTPDGPAPVLDVGIQDWQLASDECIPLHPQLWGHPASPLLFLTTRWEAHMGGYYDAESTVTWFPRQRIDGVRAALRARKHVRWGRFASAEADLTTAVKLAPHYTGARQRLAELLIRGDAVERLGRLLPLARANGFGSDTSFVLPEELDGLAPRIELPPPVTGWWPVGWDEPLTEEPNTLPVDECTNAPPAPAPWPAPPPEIFFAALTLPPLAPVQGGVPTWLALGWLAGAAWLLGRRIRVPGRWAEPWQHLSFDWRLWRVVRRGPRSK